MRLNKTWLTSRKLRVDILTIFAILMISIASIIISYSYIKSSKLILSLGADLIKVSASKVVDQLDEFIRPAALIDVANLMLADKIIDKNEQEKLVSFMHLLLVTHPQLISVYLADVNNTLFTESRVYHDPKIQWASLFTKMSDIPLGTEYISEIVSSENGEMFLTRILKDKNGNLISKKEHIPVDYKPVLQPWFQGTTKNIKNSWISLDNIKNAPMDVMTMSQRITVGHQLAGVVAVNARVDAIKRYLEEYKISQNSIAFIADHSGKVITTLRHTAAQPGILPSISDLDDERLVTAYRIFRFTNKHYFTFKLHNEEYLASFTPYATFEKNIWEIGTIVPANDFIGKSKDQYREILFFSFLMLVLGLLFVLLLSHRISRPIMLLAEETQSIKKLDFTRSSTIQTHIYEIQVLSEAFNTAKNALFSFIKYIPKELVAKLMRLGTIAQVGGERKKLTILFSDIRNFTPIAESIPPEELMLHLSGYLNIITAVIHQHHGNIDKFIGDGVMAFWGAPLDDPDQIKNACLAALSCRYQLNRMNERWKKAGKPVFFTRFGLSTGLTIVGNMGSFDRLNYTAIGDEVNLTSRLEQINKVYGTQILVSESIYEACHEEFLFRPVDVVKVTGKIKSTEVYELIAAKFGAKELKATTAQGELCDLSWSAYRAYQEKEMEKAIRLYKQILEKFPRDPVAEYYLKKINLP